MSDVALYHEIGLIARAVVRLAKVINQTQQYPKQDAEILRIRIETTLNAHRTAAAGDIARTNIDEIVRTFRKIESHGLSGPALMHCASQLELLSSALERSMSEFTRRIM